MNGITNPRVEKYFHGLLPRRGPVLSEMEAYARRHDVPIVGPAVGAFLALLVRLIRARRIFEMGSAIGYSTLWLARAAGRGATVYYTDSDPENAGRAREYFRRAGVARRVKILVGNSLDLIQEVGGTFDLIFNDVDKRDYPQVLRLAIPRLRQGGLFITDNVLWSGWVARKSSDPETRAIKRFNRLIYSSKELFPVIVPLRDGLAVCQKL
jgi:predicted O-methyltransferase YrrM